MSIKAIADRVGVSPATVSRVLNNPDYHCAKKGLRDAIWEAAIELNYTPNIAARNLKLGLAAENNKVTYINVLMTRMDQSQNDPFFGELLRVIETEIHKRGCILSNLWYDSVFSSDIRCERENLNPIIEKMYQETGEKSDGLVIVGRCNKKALEKLKKRFGNIVAVNRNPSGLSIDEVICDGKKIAVTAVDYLFSLGHRSIGYVGECKGESRYSGYIEALERHDLQPIPGYIIATKQTEADGYESMMKFLKSGDCPTGIYCANDITALGMLKCIQQHKNYPIVPSIIASDDIDGAQLSKPMLTTIRIPKDEMGKFGVMLLLDRIQGGHQSVVRMELDSRLVIRESCRSFQENTWSDYAIYTRYQN